MSLVCKIKKSLYRLKQAPRAKYQKLSSCLLSLGFVNWKSNVSLFFPKIRSALTIILIYMDDIIMTNISPYLIQQFVTMFQDMLTLKDLGHLFFFLGIEMVRTNDTFTFHSTSMLRICLIELDWATLNLFQFLF